MTALAELPTLAEELALDGAHWLEQVRELAQREPHEAAKLISSMVSGLASVAPHDDQLAGYLSDEAA